MSFDLRKQKQTIFGLNSDYLIGELLLKAGVIKQQHLDEAQKLAGNKQMQMGQMLIVARHITPRDLQAAIDAESAIRDHVVDSNLALRALAVACKTGITFTEATQKESQEIKPGKSTNKLGELLVESNLITNEQLTKALQKNMTTGLPLGRVLVLNNVISEEILASALEAQIRVRDGTMPREDAINCLRAMKSGKINPSTSIAQLEEVTTSSLKFKQPRGKGLRLGELCVIAGILSETDVLNALEVSLVNEQPLGQVLVEHGYITEELLTAALKLQFLVDTDNLDADKAIKSLHAVYANNMTLVQAIETITSETEDGTHVDFQSLLTNSHLVTHMGIQTSFELAVANPIIMAKILVMTGYLNEAQSKIILDCYDVMVRAQMSQQDALFVLEHCLKKLAKGPITFAQGLQELGWSKPVPAPATQSITMSPEQMKQAIREERSKQNPEEIMAAMQMAANQKKNIQAEDQAKMEE